MAEIKEECGVFGIYDLDGNDVTASIYYGLTSLQHRGQEACGLAVSDTKGPIGNVNFTRIWVWSVKYFARKLFIK